MGQRWRLPQEKNTSWGAALWGIGPSCTGNQYDTDSNAVYDIKLVFAQKITPVRRKINKNCCTF